MKRGILLSLACLLVIAAGCSSMNEIQKDALIGAGVGASAGAGIGWWVGGGEGAAIGAGSGLVLGGVAGALVGKYMQDQERELWEALEAEPSQEPAYVQPDKEMRESLARVAGASINREKDVLFLTFKADVLFEFDSTVLKPGAYDEIDRIAQVLNRYADTKMLVEGHTDSRGSEAYNRQLSLKRTESVRNALVARGVDSSRIDTVGFGEAKPVATNLTETGRQLNRRVRVVIMHSSQVAFPKACPYYSSAENKTISGNAEVRPDVAPGYIAPVDVPYGYRSTYYEDSGLLRAKMYYEGGIRQGVSKIYREDGSVKYIDTYVDGQKINRKAYDTDGYIQFNQDYPIRK